jgi:hypothetical protein
MLIADFRGLEGTALTCASMTWICDQLIQSCKQDGASHFYLKGREQDQKYVHHRINLYTCCYKDVSDTILTRISTS